MASRYTKKGETVKKVASELPFNAEAEKVVLGSAMIKKDYCLDMLNSLEEDDFFLGKHQVIPPDSDHRSKTQNWCASTPRLFVCNAVSARGFPECDERPDHDHRP